MKSEYKFTPYKVVGNQEQAGLEFKTFKNTAPSYSEPELFDIADESGDFFRSTEDKGAFKSFFNTRSLMDRHTPSNLVARQTAMSLNPQTQVPNYALDLVNQFNTSQGYPLNPLEHVFDPRQYRESMNQRLNYNV